MTVTTLDTWRTARLRLERMLPSDLDDLGRMNRDPVLMAMLGGPRTEAATREYLVHQLEHWEAHHFGMWMVHDAASGAFVGRAGMHHAVIDGCPETELAYALVPAAWGNGFATELAGACARAAFEVLGRRDLVAFTLSGNLASRRVMEKTGFRYERGFTHRGHPHVLYRLTAASWHAAASAAAPLAAPAVG